MPIKLDVPADYRFASSTPEFHSRTCVSPLDVFQDVQATIDRSGRTSRTSRRNGMPPSSRVVANGNSRFHIGRNHSAPQLRAQHERLSGWPMVVRPKPMISKHPRPAAAHASICSSRRSRDVK